MTATEMGNSVVSNAYETYRVWMLHVAPGCIGNEQKTKEERQ